ncbi:MAG: hypothetical protein LBL23_08210 [Coriobacteriales bacterium]|nr:hypothetical protein [Coriobacteriales bacterium]
MRHFRDPKNGREIDFIVERGLDIVTIEVKMAAADDDAKRINWLKENLAGQSVSGVIVNTGSIAYTRNDGIHVIPAALLGA